MDILAPNARTRVLANWPLGDGTVCDPNTRIVGLTKCLTLHKLLPNTVLPSAGRGALQRHEALSSYPIISEQAVSGTTQPSSGPRVINSLTLHVLLAVRKKNLFLYQPHGSCSATKFSQYTHRKASPPHRTLRHHSPPAPPHTHPHADRLRAVIQAFMSDGEQSLRLKRMEKVLNTHQVQGVSLLCLPLSALLGRNAIFLPPLNFSHIIR